ncbi:hypothetical protein C0Z10_12815 [Acidipropionibacterium jensenii]|uniref:Uncharacterized protein n=2 Tax=Acidipropionibacterium jensenii TaxID=1749 RepID=A0A3Q9UMI8_9ACTN|nr:hypothetical protein [Acidipropionibacterium jensenii]AZZ40473.1 hypothetical protein C0Z10_12815 [Acidipropionibacterium jensenii]
MPVTVAEWPRDAAVPTRDSQPHTLRQRTIDRQRLWCGGRLSLIATCAGSLGASTWDLVVGAWSLGLIAASVH